jgi:hypothetical protein
MSLPKFSVNQPVCVVDGWLGVVRAVKNEGPWFSYLVKAYEDGLAHDHPRSKPPKWFTESCLGTVSAPAPDKEDLTEPTYDELADFVFLAMCEAPEYGSGSYSDTAGFALRRRLMQTGWKEPERATAIRHETTDLVNGHRKLRDEEPIPYVDPKAWDEPDTEGCYACGDTRVMVRNDEGWLCCPGCGAT